MRLGDVLGIALSALFQQKLRTTLTLSGVVIGTFLLTVNISLGWGIQDEILRQLRRGQQLRQVLVWPRSEARAADIPPEELEVQGDMSDAKRERLRQAIVRRWQARGGPPNRSALLTRERLQRLASLEHVDSVVPPRQPCRADLGDRTRNILALAATADNEDFRRRVVAGTYLASDSGSSVVVGEYLLYRWDVRSEEEVQAVIGKKLRVEFHGGGTAPSAVLALLGAGRLELTPEETRAVEKALHRLPAVVDRLDLAPADLAALHRVFTRLGAPAHAEPAEPVVAEFTIGGVFRELTDQELKEANPLGWGPASMSRNVDVWLPVQTAEELFLRVPQNAENGFPLVLVTVDSEANVQEVTRRIREMELEEFAPANIIEQVRTNLVLTNVLVAFLAAAALLVAVLGITNTMLMGVLERTREIGVMKAVGARDSQILLLFLAEGGLLGLLGGGLGLLLSWLASLPGQAIAREVVHRQAELNLTGNLFVFPWWLTLGVPLFAGLVTTLAAVYPARRAARVNPIVALRHE